MENTNFEITEPNDWQNQQPHHFNTDEKDRAEEHENEAQEGIDENTDNDWGVVDPAQGPLHIPDPMDPSGPGSAV